MVFQTFDALPQDAKTSLILLGEDNYVAEGQSALTGEQFAHILALKLKPGKLEAIQTLTKDGITGFYALLPKELNYDKLEELTAEVAGRLRALKADAVHIALADDSMAALSGTFVSTVAG